MTLAPHPEPPSIPWDWAALRALCLREAQQVLGTCSEAEDAAQEAALRAWRRRGSCLNPRLPSGWVITIARREALRIARGRAELPVDDVAEQPQRESPRDHESTTAVALAEAIGELSREDRLLVVGRYVLDLTHRELARRSGLAEGTVRVRLHRVRSRLRDRLMEP